MKVTVTQEHIDEGVPGNCENCAIALAVKEQAGLDLVSVNTHILVPAKSGGAFWKRKWKLPQEAERFVTTYDLLGRDRVEPFSFEAEEI